MTAFSDVAAAYEGLEAPEQFSDPAKLEAYRSSMLERTAGQTALICELPGETALEVGSGNGRLLIDLARSGAITRGLGIELSGSRTAFAQRWAVDAGYDRVLEFRSGDALGERLGTGWDVAACITGTFGYFDAFVPGSALTLLQKLRAALRPGGSIVLELYPHPKERRLLDASGGTLRTWRELDADDPWRFYLSEYTIADNVLTHSKTFVHRRTGEIDEGRSERLVLYTPAEIEALLAQAGFDDVQLYAAWDRTPYSGGELLVVAAGRG